MSARPCVQESRDHFHSSRPAVPNASLCAARGLPHRSRAHMDANVSAGHVQHDDQNSGKVAARTPEKSQEAAKSGPSGHMLGSSSFCQPLAHRLLSPTVEMSLSSLDGTGASTFKGPPATGPNGVCLASAFSGVGPSRELVPCFLGDGVAAQSLLAVAHAGRFMVLSIWQRLGGLDWA